jgi:hypothetical protein
MSQAKRVRLVDWLVCVAVTLVGGLFLFVAVLGLRDTSPQTDRTYPPSGPHLEGGGGEVQSCLRRNSMGTQTKEATSKSVRRSQEGLSEEEIGRLAEKPGWTVKEAAELLWSQQHSALSIPLFADKYGLSRSRLYYWKKRIAQTPDQVCAAREGTPDGEGSATVQPTCVDDEQELDTETLKWALSQELATDSAGDRRVAQYVMQAVRAEDKMWSVFAVRASERVLWCVVRWEGKEAGKRDSLVELDRKEPALRWRYFSTRREAMDALRARTEQKEEPRAAKSERRTPLLLPVRVQNPDQGVLGGWCETQLHERGVVGLEEGGDAWESLGWGWILRNAECRRILRGFWGLLGAASG